MRYILLFTLISLFTSCNREDPFGVLNIDELLGTKVTYVSPFNVSESNFNLSANSTVTFTAEWEEDSRYELIVKGRTSKAVYAIEGVGTTLNKSWDATADLPQFVNEVCDVTLDFPDKPGFTSQTTVTLSNTTDFNAREGHFLMEDFSNIAGPAIIGLTPASGWTATENIVDTLLGTRYAKFVLQPGSNPSRFPVNFTIYVRDNILQYGGDATLENYITTTDPSKVYINFYLHVSESDNFNDFAVKVDMIDTEGNEVRFANPSVSPARTNDWQLYSYLLSDFTNSSDINTKNISGVNFFFGEADNTKPYTVNISNIIFTEGAPFSYP